MPTPRRSHRRAAFGVVALAALGFALLPSRGAGAAGASPQAQAAATWLGSELTSGGNELSNGGQVDWGLTADAAVALVAVDGSADPVATATVTNLLAHQSSYTTFDDLGAQFAGVQLAGPTAKVLLAAEAAGDGSDPVAVDLQAQLRTLVVTTGPSAGRFSDRNPYSADSSNGFGQAEAILALARTSAGVPASATDFLIAQQCPAGGFRLTYSTAACTDDSQADSDATAVAVQALLAIDRTSAVGGALSRAVAWLESIQDPSTGAFGGTGPTAGDNSNSTGLIAEALRAAGQTGPADRAASWIESLQLSSPSVAAGAIAYDPAGFAGASAAGIPALSLDQWHRATSQAVLGLGLPPLGSVGAGAAPLPAPVDPTSTTTSVSTTTSTTTSTVAPSSTTTTIASVTSSTAAVVPSTSAAQTQVEALTEVAPSSSTSTAATNLAMTGGDWGSLIAPGLMALVLGAVAVLAARFGDWPT